MMLSGSASLLLTPFVVAYIRRQRSRLRELAKPLSALQRQALRGHFSKEILGAVRTIVIDPLPIPDPPFLSVARRCGLTFPNTSTATAITFGDVVAVRHEPEASLLFHELVHVAQFHLLGMGLFAREYVRGLLRSGNYISIPLEQCAFELQWRFEMGEAFDVEGELRRRWRV